VLGRRISTETCGEKNGRWNNSIGRFSFKRNGDASLDDYHQATTDLGNFANDRSIDNPTGSEIDKQPLAF
jgi:hypothetical protein